MWVEKKTKHLHIEFIVTSHNSVGQNNDKNNIFPISGVKIYCQCHPVVWVA